MDQLDSQDRAVAERAGIPPAVLHGLKPEEVRLLACVAEHRDRIVSQPELAMHVFGKAGGVECRRIGNMLRAVRFAVCEYVTIAIAFTRFRGELALGVRWESGARDESEHTTNGP